MLNERQPFRFRLKQLLSAFLIFILANFPAEAQETALSAAGIAIIPYPKQVTLKGDDFILDETSHIISDGKASAADQFAVDQLIQQIDEKYRLRLSPGKSSSGKTILITRKAADKKLGDEGYSLDISANKIVLRANGEAGLFYGTQTLLQLIQQSGNRLYIKGMQLKDWPDTRWRAAHYDTKHHQDTRAFVENFIRDLAKYKINMLIWEWEDKFEYPSHPEIGAPGAFTMKEMQELTYYAKKYHIQIVPLVQGLGHASFILKWPQYASLREIPASNFEFCPLKEGAYQLLYDLWQDAIKATPGSEYIHIGSDETYELGACPDCKKKEEEIGRSGLYHLFLKRSADLIHQKSRRQVMVWEAPMGWAKGRLQVYHSDKETEKTVTPEKGLVLTESYDYETPDLKYAKEARSLGYPVFAYDPNPGIEQLFLPYFYAKNDDRKPIAGCLENSYRFLQFNLGKGVFDGVIRTSWDDSGLPMQAWMLCFAITAEYAWNASGPSLPEFISTFFSNRYGKQARDIGLLYRLLNDGAYFYMESFEREVWAWGNIGMTNIPDMPRGDALEYDPFWNIRYADRVKAAHEFINKMDTAISICNANLNSDIDHRYDIEVFKTIAGMVKHTALTYIDLSNLENAIRAAHEQRFVNLDSAYQNLRKAEKIIENQLARRQSVFDSLVAVWQQTRLPKGMSTATKKYFFEQDRTRHFANRVADMSYLIVDEQQLDLEGYLLRLRQYMDFYHKRFLNKSVQ